MSEIGYVIQRDDGAYVNKKNEWVSGVITRVVLCRVHRDQVLNELIELNIKSHDLRAQVLEVGLNEKGLPQLEVSYEEPEEPDLSNLIESGSVELDSVESTSIGKNGACVEYES